MKIHERTEADGSLAPIELVFDDGLSILRDAEHLPLPEGALAAVMKRYGAPLDPEIHVDLVASLDTGAGVLKHIRHLARYDVIAKDWLLYETAGEEAICALAATVAGALEHVAKAAARDRD